MANIRLASARGCAGRSGECAENNAGGATGCRLLLNFSNRSFAEEWLWRNRDGPQSGCGNGARSVARLRGTRGLSCHWPFQHLVHVAIERTPISCILAKVVLTGSSQSLDEGRGTAGLERSTKRGRVLSFRSRLLEDKWIKK